MACVAALIGLLVYGQQRSSVIGGRVLERVTTLEKESQELVTPVLREIHHELVTKGVTTQAPEVRVVRTKEPTTGRTPRPPMVKPPEEVPEVLGPDALTVVGMTVDTAEASPGDTLTYRISVRNLMDTETRFRAATHIPVNTSFRDSDECSEEDIISSSGEGIATCPILRAGVANRHQLHWEAVVPPNRIRTFQFRVIINPDTPPSYISNHAHISGPQVQSVDTNDVRTRSEFGEQAK